MKYIDEYRDRTVAAHYADVIRRTVTRPWTIMEICGGQTHTIVKYGIEEMLQTFLPSCMGRVALYA